MKKLYTFILALVMIFAMYGTISAKTKTSVAILPFTIYSAENIDYIRQGILGILSARLASSEKIEMVSRETAAEAVEKTGRREITQSTASAIGLKLKTDYVVWGSVTKIGNSISLDGKLIDISTNKIPVSVVSQTTSLDEIIPRISDFAQRINQHITGEQPAAATAIMPQPLPPRAPTPQPMPATVSTREAEIIAAMTSREGGKKATFTSIINPDFINAPGKTPGDRKGFWMSPEFPSEIKGMDIGDVTGDGQNEVVLIDNNNIMIYRKQGSEFRQISRIRGRSHLNYLAVDVADINRNGVKEIIVTCLNRDILTSFVVEFVNGKFTEIASRIPYFLRVIEPAPGQPILLGQRYGMEAPFDTPIHEMIWEKGTLTQGRRMKIPEGLSIYGLTMSSLDTGGEKIILLNDLDYLCIYEPTERPMSRIAVFGGSRELIYRSDEQFGGSNTFFTPPVKSITPGEPRNNVFLNVRILTYDMEGKGRRDIIIPKNISATGRAFTNLRLFTSSEIYSLRWDGLGLSENWRTRRINGYVSDYQIKDLDNDGKDEVVLAVVRGLGTGHRGTSVLVSYDLRGN